MTFRHTNLCTVVFPLCLCATILFMCVCVWCKFCPHGVQEMPADERETRLETILPDTTSLCAQIEHLSEALSVALAETEEGFPVYTDGPVFVLQQVQNITSFLRNVHLSVLNIG